MKNKAFTLIELLVVVLIIGILAAIALPKYELAVEKSRLSEALAMASSLQKAMDVYVLENGYPLRKDAAHAGYIFFLGDDVAGNGNLAIDFAHLDCSVESGQACASKNFTYEASCGEDFCAVHVTSLRFSYVFGLVRRMTDSTWHGLGECDYSSDDPIGEKICKQLNVQYPGEFEPCPDC